MTIEYYDKFEYLIPNLNGYSSKKILEVLNKLGEEGWEFMGNITDNIGKHQCIMKRKLITKNI